MHPSARPLSPHLQVYRWQIQMVTSILHRATGIALVAGSVLIVLMLLALASGPEHWAMVTAAAGSWLGRLVLIGWTWALCYHWINGIRHLLQDAGLGFAVSRFVANSWISVIGSLALTAAIWTCVLVCGGAA